MRGIAEYLDIKGHIVVSSQAEENVTRGCHDRYLWQFSPYCCPYNFLNHFLSSSYMIIAS